MEEINFEFKNDKVNKIKTYFCIINEIFLIFLKDISYRFKNRTTYWSVFKGKVRNVFDLPRFVFVV